MGSAITRLDEKYTIDVEGYIGIRFAADEIALTLEPLESNRVISIADLETIPTPTLEARRAAIATMLRKVAALAAENNWISLRNLLPPKLPPKQLRCLDFAGDDMRHNSYKSFLKYRFLRLYETY